MGAPNYVPELGSLDDGFPLEMAPPPLLREFAVWLGSQPRSSLGWFHVASERLDAAYVGDDDAADRLRGQLGIFIALPDGSRIALWRQLDRAPVVVLLGSKGEHATVAADLESFLLALAAERTGVAALDRSQDDTARARADLAGWLASRGFVARAQTAPPPDFARWFEATVRDAKQAPGPSSAPLSAAALPDDLFERVNPLLGCLIDEPAVRTFFEGIGVDPRSIRDPNALRMIARPSEGVAFEIAWPWDYPSQWLATEYPKPARPALEQRRARMFWGVRFYAAPERVQACQFNAYPAALPFGITPGSLPHELEAQLGPPTHGNLAAYTWDDALRRRSLTASFNDGKNLRDDLPRGALRSVSWRLSLAST